MRKLIGVAAFAAVAGLAAFWVITIPAIVPDSALLAHAPDLANGKTMFAIGGCRSCHNVPDEKVAVKLGGGRALHSPFGTFYVPNISADKKDGIGGWSEAQFVTAMTKGTSPDGAHYYPAFPYTSYQRMSTDDLRDLFAYLKTLPAVQGEVRDHDLPFPFNIRRTLGVWKYLFLGNEPFKPGLKQSAQWNRGAYLANGPGHCAECHSPRDFLGGIVSSKRFAGGPSPDGQGTVPNITQAKLKDWSVEDFATMLETGMTPDADRVGGNMADVVRNTAQLSKEDREAMAVYLKSLPPVER